MNSKITNVLMFAVGAAVGSAVTWKVVKTRYERIIQEEIESVKTAFNDLVTIRPDETEETEETEESDPKPQPKQGQINWSELEDLDEEDEEEDDKYEPTEEDMAEYEHLAASYSNEKGGVGKMARDPYVIAPYDFGELDGYHTIELTYYADDVLEDDSYCIVNDRDELIGPKALNTFGEYEDDAVFVRNERLRTDFQILRDYRTYAEARSISPKRVDDE